MAIDFKFPELPALPGLPEIPKINLKQTIRDSAPIKSVFDSEQAHILLQSAGWATVDETGTPRPFDSVTHKRAQALNEWIKSSPWAMHGLVVGSVPDGSGVRVVRLLDVGSTALVWIDIPVELASAECVVRYALTCLQGELIISGQKRIEWPVEDAWLVALHGLLNMRNVGLFDGSGYSIANPIPLWNRRILLAELRAGGIDWVEEELRLAGFEFIPLVRIPPFPPACLDVERARQAIEEADRVFGI